MLTQDPLESLRPARIDDIGGVLRLLEPLEADGTLVKRGRDLLEMEIERFFVLEHDREIIGCAALYQYEDGMAELAGLAVHPDHRRAGAGERLLLAIEARAKQRKVKRLFVLTTRTAHWFIERGFAAAPVAALPRRKQDLYNFQRRSQVLVKRL
jgi:amino-acid N-acetyltransferase